MKNKKASPWSWIPTLYFTQGLPNVIVIAVSVILYKRLGISNTDIALYTGWLHLPWVIKPFWSPFVDLFKTKRWWIVTMQLLIGAGFASVAFFIPAPFFFQLTLAFFWLIAFSSATHDIAADGFYMSALDEHEQSFFVGVRSTFFRFSTLLGQGILVMLAGALESHTGLEPIEFNVNSSKVQTEMTLHDFSASNHDEMTFVMLPEQLAIHTANITADSLANVKSFVQLQNQQHGFVKKEDDKKNADSKSWWTVHVSAPLSDAIKRMVGKETALDQKMAGNVGVMMVKLSKAPANGEEVVLHTDHLKGSRDISLLQGERLCFTSANWDKPAYLLFQLDSKLTDEVTCEFKSTSGNIRLAWSIAFFVLAGFMILVFVYHRFMLPRPPSDKTLLDKKGHNVLKEFGMTFATFFQKKHIVPAITFLLLYRLGEAQLVKIASPFLLDSHKVGGLALTTSQVGFVYGTVGIIALTIGGILGGIVVSKHGIGKWLWPMVFCMNLPNLVYVYLATAQPEMFSVTCLAVAVEQFGYGFGFTAYMLFMLYISQGEHQTSHYAICTGFMALGMMFPGMISGWIQDAIGYQDFFIWVCICTIPGFILVRFLKIDKDFGKKKERVKSL